MKKERMLQYIRKIKGKSPGDVMRFAVKTSGRMLRRGRDGLFDTRGAYAAAPGGLSPLPVCTGELDFSGWDREKAGELCRMYLAHRFDLLGSGWGTVDYGDHAKGLGEYRYHVPEIKPDREGVFLKKLLHRTNVKSSVRIWRQLAPDYVPIDWQKDFISGCRWENREWYYPARLAGRPGGDIKVPWELSRLQHLPRLALLHFYSGENRERIRKEFQNQLADFIAVNPPRRGVNYMCTMDVGIRTANIALAYSLMRGQGAVFPEEFERVLCSFMFDQCSHIYHNLEWSPSLTSNHYFADIAGLLYGSAVLPACRQRRKWLYFAAGEVNREIKKQFHPEGSGGEGSSAYHRLTGEMAVYSLALIYCLNRSGENLPADREAAERIRRAGIFSRDITRPDGMFTQIGDNDSGLFFRLSVTGELVPVQEAVEKYENLRGYVPQEGDRQYLDENMNDAGPFISSVGGMFGGGAFREACKAYPLECSLVRQLAGDRGTVRPLKRRAVKSRAYREGEPLEYGSVYEVPYRGGNLLENIRRTDYGQFGIYIFRGKHIYLCINASDNGQRGNAGHAHNDKLSFELFLDGECIFEDSGTYVYTPSAGQRDRFRSVECHNTVYAGTEQNTYRSLFSMKDETECRILYRKENALEAEVRYKGIVHRREFIIEEDRVCIRDRCSRGFRSQFTQAKVTRGYGKLLRMAEGGQEVP